MIQLLRVICLISLVVAGQVLAYQSDSSLGYVSGNLYSATSIVARLMWAACIIAGIALLITAFTQIQTHRNNPKLMPLTTPITYILLGLSALAIPFAERIFGGKDANTAASQSISSSSLDAPINNPSPPKSK